MDPTSGHIFWMTTGAGSSGPVPSTCWSAWGSSGASAPPPSRWAWPTPRPRASCATRSAPSALRSPSGPWAGPGRRVPAHGRGARAHRALPRVRAHEPPGALGFLRDVLLGLCRRAAPGLRGHGVRRGRALWRRAGREAPGAAGRRAGARAHARRVAGGPAGRRGGHALGRGRGAVRASSACAAACARRARSRATRCARAWRRWGIVPAASS